MRKVPRLPCAQHFSLKPKPATCARGKSTSLALPWFVEVRFLQNVPLRHFSKCLTTVTLSQISNHKLATALIRQIKHRIHVPAEGLAIGTVRIHENIPFQFLKSKNVRVDRNTRCLFPLCDCSPSPHWNRSYDIHPRTRERSVWEMLMASSTKFSIPTDAQQQHGHHCVMTGETQRHKEEHMEATTRFCPSSSGYWFLIFKVSPLSLWLAVAWAGDTGYNWLYVAVFIVFTQVFLRKHKECASR